MTAEWRLAHDMGSIGGGYIWPRLSIWGEDPRVGLMSRSDPQGVVGPVRYLTDALIFVSSGDFETGVDTFLSRVAGEGGGPCSDCQALAAQLGALVSERNDENLASWRRMEARLGYDVDQAPGALIESLAALGEHYGAGSVEEAAMAAPGAESVRVLREEIAAAEQSTVTCDFGPVLDIIPRESPADISNEGWLQRMTPWVAAEQMAARVRRNAGLRPGPLWNRTLADLVATRVQSFQPPSARGSDLPYGLRLRASDADVSRLAMRSWWTRDRRFEVARALGDAIWDRRGSLGPLGAAGTARQRFQRAFAQSLLCPFDDLMAYLGHEPITDGAMSSAARHFQVSERLVRSVLVNKRLPGRGGLAPAAVSDPEPRSLEERLEAA
jgi:hypothetical protein